MGTLSVDKLLKTSTGAAEFTLPATDGVAGSVWQSDGSGQLSVAKVAASNILASTITNTEIASGAAIAQSKLATIASDALSGNMIDGGTISNFASTGIDDNAAATAVTIDGSQNVSIPQKTFHGGMTTSIPVSNGQQNWVQSHESSNRGGTSWFSTHNSAGGAESVFAKGRSGTIGNYTIVQNGDTLGTFTWCADDGTDMNSVSAQLRVAIDGTPGVNDTPGKMVFLTTADGAASPTERMSINAAGAVHVAGAFSKGSGSFKIEHPLPAKTDTHYLVHSFIEGPKADLIYRGVVDLVSGSATVNIDTAAGMTDGTFVLLCDDVQSFTSNETDWDAVKGSVAGNTLTIECENASSTATISWMVIGDRKDDHMTNSDTVWTDSSGKPIIEPLKELEEESE